MKDEQPGRKGEEKPASGPGNSPKHSLMNRPFSHFLILALFVLPGLQPGMGQKIFSCDSKYDADFSVFVTDSKYDADLWVYKVQSRYDTGSNQGWWFFIDSKYDADKRIFFAGSRYDADLVVYFVESRYDAGWNKRTKMHLLF